MSQQNILLPAGPLLLVHRGWQQPERKELEAEGSPDGIRQSQFGKQRRHFNDVSVTVQKHPTSQVATKRGHGERGPKAAAGNAGRTQDWLFVDASGDHQKKDPGVQKLVRRHVMKDYYGDPAAREKKRKSRITPPAAPPDAPKGSESDTKAILKEVVLSSNVPGSATSLYGGGLSFVIKPQFYKLMQFCMPSKFFPLGVKLILTTGQIYLKALVLYIPYKII